MVSKKRKVGNVRMPVRKVVSDVYSLRREHQMNLASISWILCTIDISGLDETINKVSCSGPSKAEFICELGDTDRFALSLGASHHQEAFKITTRQLCH